MPERAELAQRFKELNEELVKDAANLRTVMTEEVNTVDGSSLARDGWIVFKHPDGELFSDGAIFDPERGDRWHLTIEGVLLLHVFQTEWFTAWQAARRAAKNRN